MAHTNATEHTPMQMKHRQLLVAAMEARNFKNYVNEWWHFTLNNEPFPDTYFNFYVQ